MRLSPCFKEHMAQEDVGEAAALAERVVEA